MPEQSRHDKQQHAEWDLRGLIGQWMDEYAQDRHYTILYLSRLIAELELARHCQYQWRLRRIEQVLELPAQPGELEACDDDDDGDDAHS